MVRRNLMGGSKVFTFVSQPKNNDQNNNSKKGLLYQYWKHRYLVLLFLPALIYYVIFQYGPIYGIQIAFKDYSLTKGIIGSKWVGFHHFERLFNLKGFWDVLRNTVIISGLKLLFGFPAPIILAILLNEMRFPRFKKIVQTISYLPHFLSWIILSSIFIQLFAPITGPINQILRIMGFNEIFFMGSTKYFRSVIVATSVWKEVGWGSIIYLAALSGIDPTQYEVAYIDGANRWHCIRYITLPGLSSVVTIMFIFAVGGIIGDDFNQIFNLLNGAVLSVGDVISTYTYRMGLVNIQYSFAAAVGLFQNSISFTLVVLANWFSKKISDYGIW